MSDTGSPEPLVQVIFCVLNPNYKDDQDSQCNSGFEINPESIFMYTDLFTSCYQNGMALSTFQQGKEDCTLGLQHEFILKYILLNLIVILLSLSVSENLISTCQDNLDFIC